MIYYVKRNEAKKPIGVYRTVVDRGFLECIGRNKKWIDAPSTTEAYVSGIIKLEKVDVSTAIKAVKEMLEISDADLKMLF